MLDIRSHRPQTGIDLARQEIDLVLMHEVAKLLYNYAPIVLYGIHVCNMRLSVCANDGKMCLYLRKKI